MPSADKLGVDSEIQMEVDPQTGDLVFHPADVDINDQEAIRKHEGLEEALTNPGSLDSRIEDIVDHDKKMWSDEDQLKDKPAERLDLKAYRDSLYKEAVTLNDDFLS